MAMPPRDGVVAGHAIDIFIADVYATPLHTPLATMSYFGYIVIACRRLLSHNSIDIIAVAAGVQLKVPFFLPRRL